MVGQFVDVFIGQFLAVHLFDTVGEQTTVQTDEVRLGQLAYQRGNVLVLHVGIGIVLGSRSGIDGVGVLGEEHHLLKCVAIFRMCLAIEDERLGHVVEALAHQGFLYLILDVLDGNVVVNVQMAKNLGDSSKISRFFHAVESLDDGIHNLVQRELSLRTIAFCNRKVFNFHCIAC